MARRDRPPVVTPLSGVSGYIADGLRDLCCGHITAAEYGAVDAALDRVRAMLWRLTH